MPGSTGAASDAAGTEEADTTGGVAEAIPMTSVLLPLLYIFGGWMYQGSKPRPPAEAFKPFAVLGAAVRALMLVKSILPPVLRGPALHNTKCFWASACLMAGSLSLEYLEA